MRVVLSGGGTGGHIMPAIAIGEALRKLNPDTELLFIGGISGMETEIVPKYDIPFQAVTSRKLRKLISPGTLGVLASLVKGYKEARQFIAGFRADVVVGTGGYAAAATVLAGHRLGIPTLIHEGNVIGGRTNRILGRMVDRVCLTFEQTAPEFPAGKTLTTGLPLRSGIVLSSKITPSVARCRFPGMNPEAFTLFITGGSQGSRAMNSVVIASLAELSRAGVQIIHHTGRKNYDEVCEKVRSENLDLTAGYYAVPFLDEAAMPLALRAADLILSRGGISSLAEATANGRPLIVVPLPTAYADHQTHNARALEKAGAAIHLPEAGLTAESLVKTVTELHENRQRLQDLAAASKAFGRPDAAKRVAAETLRLATTRKPVKDK
jgi:UDP-N-acetylglucosamine--N-acetylmuramyl-(pentapeptide) pyrophosphoryl-undecaprenol N-acetylglucosamine transferase